MQSDAFHYMHHRYFEWYVSLFSSISTLLISSSS